VAAGLALGSAETVLSPEIVAESLGDFHETEDIFARRRLVHSGCLIRKTMGDALGNLNLPMPVIFAGVAVQHLAPTPVGATCRTSSRVTRAWQARGKHFFESEEWLIADGKAVARHRRQNLYAITD
jgi:acyl dehydratase